MINVRYEDLRVDIALVLSTLEGKFVLTRKSGGFVNVEHSTQNVRETYYDYRDYYLGEQWKNQLSDQEIAIIKGEIDQDVSRTFGHEIL